MRSTAALLLATGVLWAAPPAADLGRSIRETTLDPNECWRVRDLTLAREDMRFYFTEGYLVFAKPVEGRRIAAVFTAEGATGDAEVLVMPPNRGERRSLASFTESPNLNEHFTSAVLVFSDGTYEELMEQIRANPLNRNIPEMGALASEQWAPVARNISASFETRLALDLLAGTPPRDGFFAAALSTRRLGNFDVLFDPRAPEQVILGQVAASRENRTYFDVWTSFEGRGWRTGARTHPPDFFAREYRIDATLQTDLDLSATIRIKVDPGAAVRRVLPFDLAREMRILSAKVDGQPAEVFQRDSMRANLVRNSGNDLILVVPPQPLQPGRTYEVELEERGKVVHNAGNNVYYVGARGNWYPNRYMQFASYDITFRHPKELDLVTAGRVVEEKTDGDWRITRRRTGVPIRLAGFNLGQYESVRTSRGGYSVEVYANRTKENALARSHESMIMLPPMVTFPRQRRPEVQPIPTETQPVFDPRARLRELAGDVAAALEFMASHFGPPALDTLTVSPVPGTFGQGFPGLIYLSTLTYLTPQDKAVKAMDSRQQLFFSEILQAHETAHQWWGNVVGSSGYHDDWLMEALANYSALLFLERRKGARPVDLVLEEYRDNLLAKTDAGEVTDSVGPIVMGSRLESSQAPRAWRAIIYGKGSWIMHMLRRQMGDAPFFKMLGELRRRYQYKAISTEQFRELSAGYLPPRSPDPKLTGFFDQWVYGTGIPALKLSYHVKGSRLTGTVTQSEVDKNFSIAVPVEIQFGRAKPVTRWVVTANDPVEFSMTVKQPPTRVVLRPRAERAAAVAGSDRIGDHEYAPTTHPAGTDCRGGCRAFHPHVARGRPPAELALPAYRRSELLHDQPDRQPVHEDAEHRPHRPRGRALHRTPSWPCRCARRAAPASSPACTRMRTASSATRPAGTSNCRRFPACCTRTAGALRTSASSTWTTTTACSPATITGRRRSPRGIREPAQEHQRQMGGHEGLRHDDRHRPGHRVHPRRRRGPALLHVDRLQGLPRSVHARTRPRERFRGRRSSSRRPSFFIDDEGKPQRVRNKSQHRAHAGRRRGRRQEGAQEAGRGDPPANLERWAEREREHHRCLMGVEDSVGAPAACLDEEKALDDTIVVYSGDNGFFHGEHGLHGKMEAYEEALRVPMMVRFPARDPRRPALRRLRGQRGSRPLRSWISAA